MLNYGHEIETSFHCIFCGGILYRGPVKMVWDGTTSDYLKCKKCDVGFEYSAAGECGKRAGDSFSLTYWK